MKILCLHGGNQNAQTFQKQLDAAIKVIGNSETAALFDFIDAPIRCAASLAEGRAVCNFFDNITIAEISEAHQWLTSKINAGGPYDGVIGFSQGATLVSTYLLYRQWYSHEESPLFRFAVFISGSIPLEVLKELGVPVPRAAEHVVEEAELRRRADLGPLPSHVSLARQAMFNSDDCFGLNLNKVPLELKIRIPTVHIWGANDPGFPASIHLAGLCDPYIRKTYTHNDAHEVPQDMEDAQQLGQLVLWCMQRSIWPGHLRAQ
ncbi:hypothetical protein NUW58_g280 [Xylaria curta]|uniref:Uncharacterized protein n=1 Tax=Xylaria curta TaxID=42375 RepID=A0ACC1PR95_9PEZI|nr:hypothetical protein NUW58_g280 [Xylaria curta]